VRSRASPFKWEYPLLSLRSSNSFIRLLPCRPITSIPPCIFPSVTHCRRQFWRKMWPIQFTFRLQYAHKKYFVVLKVMKKSDKIFSWNLSVTNLLHTVSFPWMMIVTQLLKIFLPFKEPNVSLPCSQNRNTQPSESRPRPTSLQSILTLIPIYVKFSQVVP